ncbi:MAG: UPF0182 family protein [Nocardioidaceae bacterium]
MSGIFEGDAGGEQPAKRRRRIPSRRPRALLPTLAIVVVLVIAFSFFVEVWTSHLWYQSLGYSNVYTRVFWTRVGLFVIFGLVMAGTVAGNIVLAYRIRPIMLGDGYRNPTIERYQDTVDPVRQWIVGGIAAIICLFAGLSAAGHWQTYMLWRNGVPFGQTDVYFHRDIGFYVFSYPWYRYLLTFGFTTMILAILATALTHYLYGGIRIAAKTRHVAAGAQMQLSVLFGVFMLLKAVAYWLDKYGLAISNNNLFTGVNYTDAHAVLPSKNILSIIAIICALLFFGNVVRPGWLLPVLGFGLLIFSAILIGGIWPAIVQRFQVSPSEADKEAAYIAKNIAATRTAYGLNQVDVKGYNATVSMTASVKKSVLKLANELPGVRLIDPKLVSPAFEALQQMRGFYQMPDVLDVDRYKFPGSSVAQDVVIGARELNLNGLKASQRNWTNEHTVYTHGYGVVAAYGDQRSADGTPVWAEQNLPSVGRLGKFQQEIYFGESEPDYSIVGGPPGKPPVELNIPSTSSGNGRDQTSTYKGSGGVALKSTFDRVLYAAKFWDSSILLSERVNSDSRIIYDRNPRQMVEKVAPWLTVDGDSYPAVVGGRLVWILDGYTTSSSYPMSNTVDLSQATDDSLTKEQAVAGHQADNINYIRNSVKATVDAYNGTVRLYQWDAHDPVLRAWMSAFPGSVLPKSAISPDLMAHLRYPEDLFKVQRELLSTYHITDPRTFYGGSENWKVPEDPTSNGQSAQPPFYLTMELPGSAPHFALSSVYTPQSRQNLASFVSVNADATSPNYGKITVLELPSDNAVSGPTLVENAIQNDPAVRQKLLSFSKGGDTQVQYGNLLTLPVGRVLMYAQPIYTFSGGTGSYPILQYVAVDIGEQVGVGRSLPEALANALKLTPAQQGNTAPPGNGSTQHHHKPGKGHPTSTVDQQIKTLLDRSQQSFKQAQAAFQAGDLGGYQTANERGLRLLDQALALMNKQSTPTTGGPTSSGPTSSGPTTGGPSTGGPTSGGPTTGSPTTGGP